MKFFDNSSLILLISSFDKFFADFISVFNSPLFSEQISIKLNYKYDESLIGGLIVQVGSTMIDTSIKNKLQQIENKMMKV